MTEQTSEAILAYVKVDVHSGSTFGTTGRQSSDTMSVVIDVNDLCATKDYRTPNEFKKPDQEFTLRIGDKVEYNGQTWEITSVSLTNPLRNAPEFIEVMAQ